MSLVRRTSWRLSVLLMVLFLAVLEFFVGCGEKAQEPVPVVPEPAARGGAKEPEKLLVRPSNPAGCVDSIEGDPKHGKGPGTSSIIDDYAEIDGPAPHLDGPNFDPMRLEPGLTTHSVSIIYGPSESEIGPFPQGLLPSLPLDELDEFRPSPLLDEDDYLGSNEMAFGPPPAEVSASPERSRESADAAPAGRPAVSPGNSPTEATTPVR